LWWAVQHTRLQNIIFLSYNVGLQFALQTVVVDFVVRNVNTLVLGSCAPNVFGITANERSFIRNQHDPKAFRNFSIYGRKLCQERWADGIGTKPYVRGSKRTARHQKPSGRKG
jgi:hypothetical protein